MPYGPSEGEREDSGCAPQVIMRPQVEGNQRSWHYLKGGGELKPELTFENAKTMLT